MVDGRQQFKRLDRNRGVNSIIFPTSLTLSEQQSRHFRWPSERHSTNAIDSKSNDPIQSIVVFPRSDLRDEKELPTVNNAATSPLPLSVSTEIGSNKGNHSASNLVNISIFVNNQMSIENGLEPLAYIDENGIFKVKYVPKRENTTVLNDNQQHHLDGQNLTSINKLNETAIISNDNLQNHGIMIETNENIIPTIDSIQNSLLINNLKLNGTFTKGASSSQPKQQKQLQQQQNELQHTIQSDDDRIIFS